MHHILDTRRFRTIAGLSVIAFSASLTTIAQAADPMTSATGGSIASGDRKFVEQATLGGMTELKASELAKDKATTQAVKDYSSRMIADHTQSAAELTKIAVAKGVTQPGTLDKSHQGDVEKLAKKSGTDFDKAYMKQMTSDHKTVISAFDKEAKSGKDADLQAFASKTLPTLQGHLDMAKTTADNIK